MRSDCKASLEKFYKKFTFNALNIVFGVRVVMVKTLFSWEKVRHSTRFKSATCFKAQVIKIFPTNKIR